MRLRAAPAPPTAEKVRRCHGASAPRIASVSMQPYLGLRMPASVASAGFSRRRARHGRPAETMLSDPGPGALDRGIRKFFGGRESSEVVSFYVRLLAAIAAIIGSRAVGEREVLVQLAATAMRVPILSKRNPWGSAPQQVIRGTVSYPPPVLRLIVSPRQGVLRIALSSR